MVKDELDKACKTMGKTHKDISLNVALTILKKRSIRMYSDVVHALYGKGPYRLHYEYKRFLLACSPDHAFQKEKRVVC